MNYERPCWGGPCTEKGMAEPGFCRCKAAAAEIERLRAALKEIQAYSVGDSRPRHTWYYDRAEAALNNQQQVTEPK